MKQIVNLILLVTFFSACNINPHPVKKEIILFNTAITDSLKKASDTMWSAKYRIPDMASCEYYITKNDSIVTQVMKDASGRVRQIVSAKYDRIRTRLAEFYENGQLKAKVLFDSAGRLNGPATYYYTSGIVKSEGVYNKGFFSGEWENYDSTGKVLPSDNYEEGGMLMKK